MARRIYCYTCRTCRRVYEIAAAEDPQSQTCACEDRTANAWTISRPELAFAPPDTTGMIFGPYNSDKWEREQALARGVREAELDPDRITIKDEEPAEAPAVQLTFL